jgi:hypothetical protein
LSGLQWIQRLTSSGTNAGRYSAGIAADASGNSYLTGRIAGTPSWPGATVSVPNSAFVASYDPNGNFRWPGLLTAGTLETIGNAVAIDPDVYLAGDFSGTMTTPKGNLASSGKDAFVASYTSAGTCRWATRLGGSAADSVKAVAADASGVWVAGSFEGQLPLPQPCTTLSSKGGNDIFVAKLISSTGACTWATSFGGSGEDIGHALAVDGVGGVYLTGSFAGNAFFANKGWLAAVGKSDVFLLKLAP